jgi:hypothetical protein
MAKTIRHRGMMLTKQEHEAWHAAHPGKHPRISKADHEELARAAGASGKTDREWHAKHGVAAAGPGADADVQQQVNPFAIGGAFLDYCVANGWLRREGISRAAKYYVTEAGRARLPEFGVKI